MHPHLIHLIMCSLTVPQNNIHLNKLRTAKSYQQNLNAKVGNLFVYLVLFLKNYFFKKSSLFFLCVFPSNLMHTNPQTQDYIHSLLPYLRYADMVSKTVFITANYWLYQRINSTALLGFKPTV